MSARKDAAQSDQGQRELAPRTRPRTQRPLQVGINLPTMEGGQGGTTAGWAALRDYARHAEALGYDSLWVPDHVLLQWQDHARGFWDGWSLLPALAAVTERVELGPLVTDTLLRNPAMLAKMAATVDEISDARLILGLGAGWSAAEERAFGVASDHRVARFEEALRILVPLLRTGHVDFAGRYYQAPDCTLRPRGPRSGGPPILIGAKGPRMLRLAATYADLWNAEGPLRQPEQFAPLRSAADAACAEVGRDPISLGHSASVVVNLPNLSPSVSPAMQRPGRPETQGPSEPPGPDQLAALLRGYARAGLTHIQVWLSPNTLASLEWFADVLERLDQGTGDQGTGDQGDGS